MKRIVFVIMMLVCTFASQLEAKTIHWLTFIDTTDPNVGEVDLNTRKILYSRWIDVVNATLKEQGYDIDVIDVYGSKTSPENCKNIVNDLDCGSDGEDIIVFYYIGHGTENTNTSVFPLMLMAQSNPNKFIPLEWVHDTLRKKGARFTLTIGMCCNARQGAPGKIAPSFSVNYGNAYVDSNMSESIKKMFLNYKGDLIVASASPAESSWACNSNIGPTDFFTLNLLIQFVNELPEKSNPDWLSMLEQVKTSVSEDVRTCEDIQRRFPGTTQTPFWKSKSGISSASRPRQTTPTPPPTPKPDTDDRTIMKTQLDRVLSYISSSNVDANQRMAAVSKIKPVFSNDLVVRIMSQDGNIVVDKESISTFLGRISTDSGLLMNVSVVDFGVAQDGRINSLKVREVIKKKK